MDDMSKEELAYRYVHGMLDTEDKMRVYELVLSSDPEFTKALKEEVLLVRSMRSLRSTLDKDRKQEMLLRIKQSRSERAGQHAVTATVLKSILRMTMPSMAYHTLIKIKGDVLA